MKSKFTQLADQSVRYPEMERRFNAAICTAYVNHGKSKRALRSWLASIGMDIKKSRVNAILKDGGLL